MNRKAPETSFFRIHVLPLAVGILLTVATMAFIGIPWSLGGHPGEAIAVAPTAAFHSS